MPCIFAVDGSAVSVVTFLFASTECHHALYNVLKHTYLQINVLVHCRVFAWHFCKSILLTTCIRTVTNMYNMHSYTDTVSRHLISYWTNALDIAHTLTTMPTHLQVPKESTWKATMCGTIIASVDLQWNKNKHDLSFYCIPSCPGLTRQSLFRSINSCWIIIIASCCQERPCDTAVDMSSTLINTGGCGR